MPFDGGRKDQMLVDLLAVKALILDPENWTQNCLARTRRGDVCSPTHSGAVKFCAQGAVLGSLITPIQGVRLVFCGPFTRLPVTVSHFVAASSISTTGTGIVPS